MKRLYLLRHAKAEDEHQGKPDIERHLHERGIAQAERLSAIMNTRHYIPTHIFSSPANRTVETSEIVLKSLNDCEFSTDKSLYNGDIDDVINICFQFDENVLAPMIVFHNPGITYFANVICDANIENVPTCGLLVMDIDSSSWKNLDPSNIKLIDFINP